MTYRIHRNRERGVWQVFSTGEFARFVAEFPTLLEAERYVTRGEAPVACAHGFPESWWDCCQVAL